MVLYPRRDQGHLQIDALGHPDFKLDPVVPSFP